MAADVVGEVEAERRAERAGAGGEVGREQADAFTRRRPEARVHPVPGWTGHHLGLAENPQAPAAAAGAAFSVPSDGFFYALFVR